MFANSTSDLDINNSMKVAYKLEKANCIKICDGSDELCLLKSYLHDPNLRFPTGSNGVVLYELMERLGQEAVADLALLTGKSDLHQENCWANAKDFRQNNYKSEDNYKKKRSSLSTRMEEMSRQSTKLMEALASYSEKKGRYLDATRPQRRSSEQEKFSPDSTPEKKSVGVNSGSSSRPVNINIMSGGRSDNPGANQFGGMTGDGDNDGKNPVPVPEGVKGPSLSDISKLTEKEVILYSYGPDNFRPESFKCETESSSLPHNGQSDDIDTVYLDCDKVNEKKKGYDVRFTSTCLGKFDIYGGTGKYTNMIKFLEMVAESGMPIAYVWAACTQFTLKPTELIKTGYTKKRKGDGFGFAKEFRHFLPMFDENEIKNPQDMQKFQRRSKYPTWAKFVNKSMCYRICFFYIMQIYETGQEKAVAERDELFDQWTLSLNFNPATVTKEILEERMPNGVSSVKDEVSIFGGKVGEEWVKIKMKQCEEVRRGMAFMSQLPHFETNRHEKVMLDKIFTNKFIIKATVDQTNTVQYTIPQTERSGPFN